MNKKIFKAYDIRGLYPADINDETVNVIGQACFKLFTSNLNFDFNSEKNISENKLENKSAEIIPEIIIAHDARHGSPELMAVLQKCVEETASRTGLQVKVHAVGLSTTPMFYFLVNHFGAIGGCMITASHNPKEYNGMKIVREKAIAVSGTELLEVVETL